MQSNGGVATADGARELPIALAASGPAAGVIGGARLGELVGERDVLTFDMGGTTADIGLVVGASPQLRFSGEAAGMPVNLPQIDVLCIGAGGGSIAQVDDFGSLSVGPRAPAPSPARPPTGAAAPTPRSPTPTSCSAPSAERALGRAAASRRPLARAAVERAGRRRRSASAPSRPPQPSCASPTPTWQTRFA